MDGHIRKAHMNTYMGETHVMLIKQEAQESQHAHRFSLFLLPPVVPSKYICGGNVLGPGVETCAEPMAAPLPLPRQVVLHCYTTKPTLLFSFVRAQRQ